MSDKEKDSRINYNNLSPRYDKEYYRFKYMSEEEPKKGNQKKKQLRTENKETGD